MEAELGGHDLAALGLPRGPLYGQILEALRRARLDGEVSTREEELAWVQKRFLGHGR